MKTELLYIGGFALWAYLCSLSVLLTCLSVAACVVLFFYTLYEDINNEHW